MCRFFKGGSTSTRDDSIGVKPAEVGTVDVEMVVVVTVCTVVVV